MGMNCMHNSFQSSHLILELILQQNCMDPRPVDFSYRRPRPDNLTYQSYGLAESIFHIGSYAKKFPMPQKAPPFPIDRTLRANPEQLIHARQSKWNVKEDQLSKSYIYENPSSFSNVHTRRPKEDLSKSELFEERRARSQNRGYEIQNLAKEKIQNQADSLSNWTYSLMKPNKKGQMQDLVYEYQQKPYNIINNVPKIEPDTHRQYPRFSLEHKLVGHYEPAPVPSK